MEWIYESICIFVDSAVLICIGEVVSIKIALGVYDKAFALEPFIIYDIWSGVCPKAFVISRALIYIFGIKVQIDR